MSVVNLLNASKTRLLNNPWNKNEKSWNAAALEQAKKTADAWKNLYPMFKRRTLHRDPMQPPKVVTFAKVDDDLIAPMLALGGKPLTQ